MLGSDRNWEKFGRLQPYYAVLADERFAPGAIEANRESFFQSGRDFVDLLIGRFERHFGPLDRGSALDHGCGVGRLTLPLAGSFDRVVGIDVSPAMLDEARANASTAGLANISFALADDELSNAPGEHDFVNSYITLQHIPVRRGMTLVSNLADRVRPGGGLHLHVSIRTDGLGSRALWWASHHVPGVKIWQNICAGRKWDAPAMQMNDYDIGAVIARLCQRGFEQMLVVTERHDKFLTCSFIGRKRRG